MDPGHVEEIPPSGATKHDQQDLNVYGQILVGIRENLRLHGELLAHQQALHFRDGLNAVIQQAMAAHVLPAFEAALASARSVHNTKKNLGKAPATVADNQHLEPQEQSLQPSQKFKPKQNKKIEKATTSSSISKKSRVCYHCRKMGHTMRNCRKLLGQCFTCGGSDHFSKGCPHRQVVPTPLAPQPSPIGLPTAGHQRPSIAAPGLTPYDPREITAYIAPRMPLPSQQRVFQQFQKNQPEKQAFVMTAGEAGGTGGLISGIVLIKSFPALTLFDTGASRCFMARRFMAKHAIRTQALDRNLMVNTGNGPFKTTQICRGYPVVIQGRQLYADFIIMDMLRFDAILGMDWLRDFFATIDCPRMRVVFELPGHPPFSFRNGSCSLGPVEYIAEPVTTEEAKEKRPRDVQDSEDDHPEEKTSYLSDPDWFLRRGRLLRLRAERKLSPGYTRPLKQHPVRILGQGTRKQGNKKIRLVRVMWQRETPGELTWEREDEMRAYYPYLFPGMV